MASNNYFNVFIFTKYFPARSIPSVLKKINTILFVVGLVISGLLVLVIVVGSMEEFDGRNGSLAGKIALLVFMVILINWVYILCMQIKMFNVIKRESYTSITNTINSIGQE